MKDLVVQQVHKFVWFLCEEDLKQADPDTEVELLGVLNFVEQTRVLGPAKRAEVLLEALGPAKRAEVLPEAFELIKAQHLHQGKGERRSMVGEIPLPLQSF